MVFISEIPEPVGDNNGLLQLADCQNFVRPQKIIVYITMNNNGQDL